MRKLSRDEELSLRAEIEHRGGCARVWLGDGVIEVLDHGLTPDWALRRPDDYEGEWFAVAVEVDVDIDDGSEDWLPGVVDTLNLTLESH